MPYFANFKTTGYNIFHHCTFPHYRYTIQYRYLGLTPTLRITKDSLKAESFGNDTKCDEKREINCRTTIMHIMERDPHSDADLKKIYLLKNIAVVGMSKNEEKPGHFVPKYLIEHGYNVIPVNPKVTEVLGRKSYPSITDIGEKIEIVDIFRKSEDVPAVIDDVINRKKDDVKVIWMQEGIYNEEAEKRAKGNSMDVVYNRCMMAEHRRLF